jgi:hypothetical protein
MALKVRDRSEYVRQLLSVGVATPVAAKIPDSPPRWRLARTPRFRSAARPIRLRASRMRAQAVPSCAVRGPSVIAQRRLLDGTDGRASTRNSIPLYRSPLAATILLLSPLLSESPIPKNLRWRHPLER